MEFPQSTANKWNQIFHFDSLKNTKRIKVRVFYVRKSLHNAQTHTSSRKFQSQTFDYISFIRKYIWLECRRKKIEKKKNELNKLYKCVKIAKNGIQLNWITQHMQWIKSVSNFVVDHVNCYTQCIFLLITSAIVYFTENTRTLERRQHIHLFSSILIFVAYVHFSAPSSIHNYDYNNNKLTSKQVKQQ